MSFNKQEIYYGEVQGKGFTDDNWPSEVDEADINQFVGGEK